jgi:hypothetical protein
MGSGVYGFRMPPRLLFADTNVFLHCTFFTDLDWRTLVSGEDVVLTICPTVMSELDKKKFSDPSRRVKERAKAVVRRIGELVSDDQPVQFRQGCSLWVMCRSPLMDFTSVGLSKEVADDAVIASALEEREKGNDVTLVAADTGIRLKGNTHRLRTVLVPKEWLLLDEPDEQERELQKLRRQAAESAAAAPNLRLTFGPSNVAEFCVKPRKPMSPEVIKRKLDGMRRLKVYQPMTVPAYGGLTASVLGGVTREEVSAYNQALKAYFAKYEDHLKRSHEIFEARDLTLKLDITVENTGQESAESVDVVVQVTGEIEGIWADDQPEGSEKAPKRPEPPRGSLAALAAMPAGVPMANIRSLLEPRENAVTVPIDYERFTEARFHVNLVKPRFPVPLPSRYFLFSSFDDARSFTLSYELFGKNLRSPQSGELHVKISR